MPQDMDPYPMARDACGTASEDDVAELKLRLQELEETLRAIHSGDVDALVVNGEIYTLETVHATGNRLRQDVLAQMEDAVFAFDNEDHLMYLNAAAEKRYGVVATEVLGRPRAAVFLEMQRPNGWRMRMRGEEANDGGDPVSIHQLPDGKLIHVESVVSTLIGPTGEPVGSLAVIRDVTERLRAELRRDGLARLSERLHDVDQPAVVAFEAARVLGATLEVSHAGYGTLGADGVTLMVERDWAADGLASLGGALDLRELGAAMGDLARNRAVAVTDVRSDARTVAIAAQLEACNARSLLLMPVVEQGRLMAVLFAGDARARPWTRDDLDFMRQIAERARAVTERVRSERQLREANENLEATVAARTRELMVAEESLRQAQKMEALGQLTGGIAHDFNNLLGGVSASLQVLQKRLLQGKVEDAERYIAMGQESIKRAAALTQRLLAFARRQTLDPKPVDVTRLIASLADLVRRTVGPNVRVEVDGTAEPWLIRVDASQLENSLLNLCINARDAMLPDGGRLTIATSNLDVDDRSAVERGVPVGQYVAVSVTDTGSGMAAHVIEHIFDPFFTTKPTGQGTGLGLSMVYGFVRQSGGRVQVESAPGLGTTMHLYLPRYQGPASDEAEMKRTETVENGEGETVLVVEDEKTIRVLIAEVLEEAGYVVVTAPDGPAGLRVLQSGRRVDLLVTDVGLPGGLNGRQVADAARLVRPDLKVLFITGYAENAATGRELLDQGMHVLAKPFEIIALAQKVRAMTGGGPPGQSPADSDCTIER
ncbi:MAG TPA: ATP-binding protein [Ramlibacter sp.]|nr:ATP-binding protein [Ramlibacter sp.]